MKSLIAFFAFCLAAAALPTQAAAPPSGWTPLMAPKDAMQAVANEHGAQVIDIRAPIDFNAGHIEGAVNAPYHMWRGPDANPGGLLTDAEFTDLLQRSGVERARPVIIVYRGRNATDFGAAARVYWTLKSAGIERIAILNGGMKAWIAEGLEISTTSKQVERSTIEVTLSHRWLIDRAGVADVIEGRSEARLIDARPLEFFEGRKKHSRAFQAGTLKGALNVIHSAWFGDDKGMMVSTPEAVATIAARAGYDGPLQPGETLVSFCNTGHWAATNWFALSEVAGIENVKLYPESLVGWSGAGGSVVAQ